MCAVEEICTEEVAEAIMLVICGSMSISEADLIL
jgi:hypothetical protein